MRAERAGPGLLGHIEDARQQRWLATDGRLEVTLFVGDIVDALAEAHRTATEGGELPMRFTCATSAAPAVVRTVLVILHVPERVPLSRKIFDRVLGGAGG